MDVDMEAEEIDRIVMKFKNGKAASLDGLKP